MTERDDSPLSEVDDEVPEADALEQRAGVVDTADDVSSLSDPDQRDLEADPADVAEQSRTVDADDDEYR